MGYHDNFLQVAEPLIVPSINLIGFGPGMLLSDFYTH